MNLGSFSTYHVAAVVIFLLQLLQPPGKPTTVGVVMMAGAPACDVDGDSADCAGVAVVEVLAGDVDAYEASSADCADVTVEGALACDL